MAQTMSMDPAAARAIELVRNGDLSTLTFKSIMNTLQAELGDEIRSRKSELRALVNQTIEEMNENQGSGEESEPAADTSEESEPAPTRHKRKAPESPKRKSQKRRNTGSGIQKAIGISTELAAFLGVEPDEDGAKMARTEVTRRMIQYVKENSLQSATDGRNIICDEALTKLLGVQQTTFFGLQKVLAPHFEKSSSSQSSSSKKVKRASGGSGKSGFHKPYALSHHLQALLGTSEPMSRPQIVKRIWAYVKENDLQNPKDKRFILCDSAMKSVFKCNNLHCFKMNKILSNHISPAEGDVVAKTEPLSQESEVDENEDEEEDGDEYEVDDVKPRIKTESGD